MRLIGSATHDTVELNGLLTQPPTGLTVDGEGCIYDEGQVPASATKAIIPNQVQDVAAPLTVPVRKMRFNPLTCKG